MHRADDLTQAHGEGDVRGVDQPQDHPLGGHVSVDRWRAGAATQRHVEAHDAIDVAPRVVGARRKPRKRHPKRKVATDRTARDHRYASVHGEVIEGDIDRGCHDPLRGEQDMLEPRRSCLFVNAPDVDRQPSERDVGTPVELSPDVHINQLHAEIGALDEQLPIEDDQLPPGEFAQRAPTLGHPPLAELAQPVRVKV